MELGDWVNDTADRCNDRQRHLHAILSPNIESRALANRQRDDGGIIGGRHRGTILSRHPIHGPLSPGQPGASVPRRESFLFRAAFRQTGKGLFSPLHRTVSGLFSLISVVSPVPRPATSFTRNFWIVYHWPRAQLRIDQNWKIISRHWLTRWLGLQFEIHARVRRFYP